MKKGSPPSRGKSKVQVLPAETFETEDLASLPAVPETLPAATDTLRRYLDEIRRIPLLSAQDELNLVGALRKGGAGDTSAEDAFRKLVQANLRLVAKIAFEYRNMFLNIMDLIQEGNLGLMKAVSKYDPSKGARLSYYASWWIRSYILKYLLDNFRLVKIGTTQAQKKLFYHLVREQQRLEAQGLSAGPKLLAEKLDVREKDVIEMSTRLSGGGAEMSLDSPIRSDVGPKTHGDLLVDDREGADSVLEREELLKKLSAKIPEFRKLLSARELSILQERVLSDQPKTLQEVADLYGLTRERVRQIESGILAKLRKFLRPTFGPL